MDQTILNKRVRSVKLVQPNKARLKTSHYMHLSIYVHRLTHLIYLTVFIILLFYYKNFNIVH